MYVEGARKAPLPGQTEIQEAGSRDVAKKAIETAQDLGDSIRAFSANLIGSFEGLTGTTRPTKATIEFGVSVR